MLRVFAHKMLGFAWQFLSIFFVWIWLDFFRHHLLQQSDFVKGNAIETCHPLPFGTIFSHGETAIGQPVRAALFDRKNCWQEGLLGPEWQIVASEVPQITLGIEL